MAEHKAVAVENKPTDRELRLRELQGIALEHALKSQHPKNLQSFVIEDTGPGGPLKVTIPSLPQPKP
jgi:hypothetical protein